MKYFMIFLIFVGCVGVAFAESAELHPEPTPKCPEGTIVQGDVCIEPDKKCGKGTAYQDGMCVVIKNEENQNSSDRWGQGLHNLTIDSPLKQFKSGFLFSEIKCNGTLLLTQRYDDSPACVKSETVFELIKRGWVSNMIIAVQSRDVFLDPQDATSSYMEKIIPTLDDFKNTLSEPYSIDTIFSKFGEPHDDIGSGIHIYVYELNDSTEIWIGYTDHIWYVKHVDLDGNVLEELFVENENYELITLFKNTPEVKAFHLQYEDAQTSVREDHVSYFSGSEDGYLVRMNLYFDENYALGDMDFHCYYQKVHQFEFPQENIASKIEKYDCKEYSEPKNED